MDETGSLHATHPAHCFCLTSKAGQKFCCQCGLVLVEALQACLPASQEQRIATLTAALREACDLAAQMTLLSPFNEPDAEQHVARLRQIADGPPETTEPPAREEDTSS